MERGLLLTLAHPYFLRNEAQTYVSLCLSTAKVKQNKASVLKEHEAS